MLVAFLPFCAQGQTAESAGAQQPGVPQAQNKIRVHTEEVIAPVTVLDKQGAPVLDLTPKDFHVFDNGVEQTIDHWDMGGDPLAVALVIETSSHIAMMAPVIHGMGSIFTETVMALNGEAAVISYDSTVDVRQPFTHDHDDVQQAIAQVKFEAPEMRLYDAMAEAVEQLKTRPIELPPGDADCGRVAGYCQRHEVGPGIARRAAGEHCDLCDWTQQQHCGLAFW